ncbi:MAG: aminotransferase class V-fold PLP-dependent enzyme [Candidatus Latescibacterota bacterium]|nr:aminotransferase class V-fold PLP-dependent enzyme [Candidatus Latescibacterota bacterium]
MSAAPDPTANPVYARLGVPTFINARGTITTLGGSVMPPEVVEAMAAASRSFVPLGELHEKVGARIAALTGVPAAFVCAGAASGMLLSGAACLTGTDEEAIASLPDTGDRPNQFIISQVDGHYYVHQGFRVCGGELVKVGSKQAVTTEDYENAICERTAAIVFFLGSQTVDQLAEVVAMAHDREIPVIVDAAAQLPPKSNLTDLATAIGADLVVFSGGKGLFGPQSSGLILGGEKLVRAASMNSNPHSGVGRAQKVGKEEIVGILRAVELFMEADEAQTVAEWERRCRVVGAVADDVTGISADYTAPYENRFPPASPLVHLRFDDSASLSAREVASALEEGRPAIIASASDTSLTVGPQTLQDGEAEIIAERLRAILKA